MPVSMRVSIEISRGSSATPAASSACATRWASSAWMPGQVARISSCADVARGRIARARRLHVATQLLDHPRELEAGHGQSVAGY